MRHITTTAEWNAFSNYTTSPIIIDVYADWCGPCRAIEPYFQQLSEMFRNIEFVKINIDEVEEELSEMFQIQSLPTFLLLKRGKIVTYFTGASKIKLQDLIHKAQS